MLDLWFAITLVLLTIVIVYFSLFKFLKFLYQKHFLWFVASIIFLSPSIIVFSQARNLLELMWILLLTPFYGVLVVSTLSTIWIVRFYCLSFALLLIAQFLLHKRKTVNESRNLGDFEMLLAQHLKEPIYFVAPGLSRVNRIVRKGDFFAHGLWKYWSCFLSIILLATLAITLVSSVNLRNPTYLETQQFITLDKTESHKYIEESYTCINFATDFRNNALRAGYECDYVFVYFPDSRSHVLNCFNTTDKGLVFVEPQLDCFVNLTVGRSYLNASIISLSYNDTVLGYYIDWYASP
jgi:hypothetical protein